MSRACAAPISTSVIGPYVREANEGTTSWISASYVCMYVWRQGAALGPLWCPQPTFRFEGHIGDIHAKRTAQAGELYNGHARVKIELGR